MKRAETKMSMTSLRRGDVVMVIAGGNKTKRPLKGKVGKILRFVGRDKNRAIVEGLNLVVRHQRAKGPGTTAGRIQKEAPIHVSRLMYYVEKLKQPVRLCNRVLGADSKDKKKVRGYVDPSTREFVQIVDA